MDREEIGKCYANAVPEWPNGDCWGVNMCVVARCDAGLLCSDNKAERIHISFFFVEVVLG
jgi:hypothetical protein